MAGNFRFPANSGRLGQIFREASVPAADSANANGVTPSDLPSCAELSIVFHTPRTQAWKRIAATLSGGPLKGPFKRIEGGIYSRSRKQHLDFEARPAADRRCIEWDIYLHQRFASVAADELDLSKKIGWVEGWGHFLQAAYSEPLRPSASCSAKFELQTESFSNVLGIPREAPVGFVPPELGSGLSLFSIGVQSEDLRVSASVTPDERLLILGLGFYLPEVMLKDLIAQVELHARERAVQLVRRRS